MVLFATLSTTALNHYAECHVRFIVMQNVVKQSVVLLSVIAPIKLATSVNPKKKIMSKCTHTFCKLDHFTAEEKISEKY
jgi:hypothetical protein